MRRTPNNILFLTIHKKMVLKDSNYIQRRSMWSRAVPFFPKPPILTIQRHASVVVYNACATANTGNTSNSNNTNNTPNNFKLDSNSNVDHAHIGYVNCGRPGCMGKYCEKLCAAAQSLLPASTLTKSQYTDGQENVKVGDTTYNGENRPQYAHVPSELKEYPIEEFQNEDAAKRISPAVAADLYMQQDNRAKIIHDKVKDNI